MGVIIFNVMFSWTVVYDKPIKPACTSVYDTFRLKIKIIKLRNIKIYVGR